MLGRMMPVLGGVILIALLSLADAAAGPGPQGAPVAAGDWPMYGHDPGRTNYNAAETTISAANVGQLVSRWQAFVGSGPSPTSSAPSVANGRVYVGSSVTSGPNFFAFDALSGAPVWNTNLGRMPACEDADVGIGATAAISGDVVVAGGGDAAYYGLDAASGGPLWRNPMNAGPNSFAWESPLLVNGRAYLGMSSYCDQPSVRGEIRALDLRSGVQVANQYFVPPGQIGAGIWNSPALSGDGQTLVVATGEDAGGYDGPYNRALISLAPLSLTIEQANKQGPPGEDADYGTTPIIFHDSAGRALTAAVQKSGTIFAMLLDNIAAGPVWSRATGVSVGMMPAYDPTAGPGGTLFVSAGTQFYALDPATGQDRWPAVATDVLFGNMAIANGLIFLNEGGAGLAILDERDGHVVRVLTPANAGDAFSGVAVANGVVYWLSGATLNAWSLPPGGTPTPTPVAPTTTPCAVTFSDVPPDHPFYPYVRCLACRGVLNGYADGTFRPAANITRGEIAKVVANAAAYSDPIPATQQTFADVPPAHPFWLYAERVAVHGAVAGYACGGVGEPCPGRYFRPDQPVTRGQLAKFVANAADLADPVPSDHQTFTDVPVTDPFWLYLERLTAHGIIGGYACGSPPSGACDADNRPYALPANPVTRGQTAKYIGNAFFPNCQTPARKK